MFAKMRGKEERKGIPCGKSGMAQAMFGSSNLYLDGIPILGARRGSARRVYDR